MKFIIKRYGWHILLLLNIYCIAVFSAEIFQMYHTINRTGGQTVDGLSNKSIQFMIDTYEILDFTFLEEENTEFVLMQRLSDNMPVYKVIYTNNYFRVEEGRGFNKEGFERSQPLLVCGNKAEEIMEVNPFVYRNEEYYKIGTLCNNNTIATEYGVFLAEDSFGDCTENKEYILEGFDKRSIEQIFSEIEIWAEKQGYTIKILYKAESHVNDIYNVSDISLSIVILSLLFLSSSIVLIVYFWLCQYKELEKVYFLTGMRNLKLKICIDYTKLLILGYIGSLLTAGDHSLTIRGTVFLILYFSMMLVLALCFVIRRKETENEKNMGRNSV